MTGYRRLALAVIEQAVDEATKPLPQAANDRDRHNRLDARQFLGLDTPDLQFWCEAAGLDWRTVQRRHCVDAWLAESA